MSIHSLATTRRRTGFAALALVGVLAVSACSGGSAGTGGDGASGESTGGSSSSGIPDTASIISAVTADSALAGQVPATIKSAGVLNVGSNVQSPPNNFYDADGKTVVGFEKDLITAVSAKLGLKVKYSDMAFDSLITSLSSGRIDATIAGMNVTKERQQTIDFVSYFNSGITIMVQKGNPAGIKSSDDLCGKEVAVVTGTSQEAFTTEQSAKCTAAGKDALKVTSTDSDSQNQTQLRTGRVKALVNDLPSASYIARTAGGGKYFEVVDQPPLDGAPYGIGINKKNRDLTDATQKALQALIDDGTYSKILEAWQVQTGAITKAVVNGATS